jgi:hypothetical protein
MNTVYIRVFAYLSYPTGFSAGRKPTTAYKICIRQEFDENQGRQIATDLTHEEAEKLSQEWADLLGCNIRYFEEKRVTTTTAVQVTSLPKELK